MVRTSMHEYKSDPQSGAGNCTCGQAERHRNHFHKFVKAMGYDDICTCALTESATCHIAMVHPRIVCVNCGEHIRTVGPETWHVDSTMFRCDLPGNDDDLDYKKAEFRGH